MKRAAGGLLAFGYRLTASDRRQQYTENRLDPAQRKAIRCSMNVLDAVKYYH
jgi:hypothetical protein